MEKGDTPKGDVLATARIAGIMAAKRTHELIPLCHPLNLSKVAVHLELNDKPPGVRVVAEVKTAGQTGVEMEALTAVSVACLTLYDMLKAVDRAMRFEGIRLLEKVRRALGRLGARPRKALSDGAAPGRRGAGARPEGVAPLPSETVGLLAAPDRVLAETIVAQAHAAAVQFVRHGRLRRARRRTSRKLR